MYLFVSREFRRPLGYPNDYYRHDPVSFEIENRRNKRFPVESCTFYRTHAPPPQCPAFLQTRIILSAKRSLIIEFPKTTSPFL